MTASMSWPEFFKRRRQLQLIQRLGGIPWVFGFMFAEGTVLSLPIFDPTKTIFDLDPLVVVGLGTAGGLVGSYLFGVGLTGWLWRKWKPSLAKQLEEKQRDYYRRITLHRANVPPNPTQINFSFDYYGEKVRSIADYRNWLRRQAQLKRNRIFSI